MLGENGFLKQIHLRNLLSYGNEGAKIDLKSLNVIIGPNTSGKSNLIEALRLLRAAPQKGREIDISNVLSKGGGVSEWIWKGGSDDAVASVEVITEKNPFFNFPLRYEIQFRVSKENRFELVGEAIVRQKVDTPDFQDHQPDYFYQIGSPPTLVTYVEKEEKDQTKRTGYLGYADVNSLDLSRSILSQRDDFERFPNISYLADEFLNIKIYRDLDLGYFSPIRGFTRTDEYQDFLLEDASNLALILHYLHESTDTSNMLYDNLGKFSKFFDHITSSIRGGGIQFYIHEKGFDKPISTRRLSEGYVHFLCLLAILCHQEPPPVVCIEEPELCMHPDILYTIADLLIDASSRTQLFVTTHSEILVSALSEHPECVIVCERDKNGSHLNRLETEKLKDWLKDYSLGALWRMGELGGNP